MIVRNLRLSAVAAIILTSAALAGCGGDGVELNGKIFDALGVSESAQKTAAREPKLPARTGLVMPPDANRLPEPGSAGEPDVAAQLNDPDRKKVMAAAERERLHKSYCSGQANWKERAQRKDGAEVPSSPFGPCTFGGGLLNN